MSGELIQATKPSPINEALTRAAFKMIKSLVSPEQIKTIAADMLGKAIAYKDTIELDPINGEADATAIFYEVGGCAHFAIAIMDTDNRIVRFENIQTLDNLIEKLIENL